MMVELLVRMLFLAAGIALIWDGKLRIKRGNYGKVWKHGRNELIAGLILFSLAFVAILVDAWKWLSAQVETNVLITFVILVLVGLMFVYSGLGLEVHKTFTEFGRDEKQIQKPKPAKRKKKSHFNLINLAEIIAYKFDLEEVRWLCFYLDIDYDSLRGEGKDNKVRELIKHLDRHNRIPDLLEIGKNKRPDIAWDDLVK